MDVLDDEVVEAVATVQWDCDWTMPIEHDGKEIDGRMEKRNENV